MQRESVAPDGSKGEVRPRGAMTQAMAAHVDWSTAGERELRVAALRDGRLGDEVRHPRRLRVGPTEKADVVVPIAPRTLFERRSEGWVLRLSPELSGRVASGGPARSVAELRAEGVDRLRLAPDARGRVELGGVSILFQLVPPRPKTKRAPLPQSVRGGFAIDWRFTTSLASMATLLFGLLIGLEGADWPVQNRDVLPPIYDAMLTFDEPEPPPAPITDATERTSEDPVTEAPTDANPSPRDPGPSPRPSPSDGQPSLDREQIARDAHNQVIASLGGILDGSFGRLIDTAAPTGDLESILREVDGVDGTEANGDRFVTRDTRGSGEDGPLGELDGRGPPGPTMDGEGTVTETEVTGPTTDFGPFRPEEPRVFDDEAVLRRLRGVKRQVQRCYEREVTRDPTLEGRIDVELEVHPAGNTSARVTADGVGSRPLAECITRAASGIRFADGPEGGSVRYSFPFLFAPQR